MLKASTTLGVMVAGLLCWSAPALAAAPEAPVTEAASALTASSGTLHGELNPGASATTGYDFVYGTGGSCSEGVTATEPGAEATGKSIKVSTAVTGLEPSKEYTFCVVATHAEGETTESTLGQPLTFKTSAAPPAIDSESGSGVTSSEATLEAQINPNNQETTYSFQYASNEALTGATTLSGAEALGAEDGERRASVATGAVLTPGTTYYFRAIAENVAHEKTEGPVEHFTTLDAPVVTTGQAQRVTRTSAALSGSVNPQGAPTTYHFAYINQTGYEAAIAASAANPYGKGAISSQSASVGSDYTVHAVGPLEIGELRPGVTYHYALVATNSVSTSFGADATFTTSPPTPPTATTGQATGVSQLSATLTGAVDTRGLPSTLQFEFGPTPGHGSLVPASVIGGSESGTTVGISASFGSYLQPGTTYYYRALATNADGTAYGAEQSLTTASYPPAFTPPAAFALIPYTSIAALDAKEARESPNALAPKPLTKAQRLARALKACSSKPKKQRARCKRLARKRYGSRKK
jgi:hypothetical protein